MRLVSYELPALGKYVHDPRVLDVPHGFEANFPTLTLRLKIAALGVISQLVHEGTGRLRRRIVC
jgi:hypothetical protein